MSGPFSPGNGQALERARRSPVRARAVDAVLAALAVGVATGLSVLLRLNAPTVGLLLLISVLAAALSRGAFAGTLASVVATLSFNFFFLPPIHTFTIAEPANWVALGSFLLVSTVVSRLVLRARQEADEARAREGEIQALYELSLDLFAATNRLGALGEAATRALRSVGAGGGGLLLLDGEAGRPRVISWTGRPLGPEHERLVRTVVERKEVAEVPSGSGLRDVYFPLALGARVDGVLAVLDTPARREILEPVGRLVALSVEREKFLAENAHFEALRQSEGLKTSLLRAVSHDLRTPLTAIRLRIQGLKRSLAAQPAGREALVDLERETARLTRRIDNLLSLARLEAGRSVPNPEPTPPADLFRAAREGLPLVLDSLAVHVSVSQDCPDVWADPSLAVEILINLVENAARASSPGSSLELTASRHPVEPGIVRLEVADRGGGPPGVGADANVPEASSGAAAGAVTAEPSVDGARRGLGLEIARGLAVANGGVVVLVSRPGGGTVARVDLPAATPAAEEPLPAPDEPEQGP